MEYRHRSQQLRRKMWLPPQARSESQLSQSEIASPKRLQGIFADKNYDRPKAKEEGPSPKGRARKGRAYLTGERFGNSKVIVIVGGRCLSLLFGFDFRLKDIDSGSIQRVLEMDGVVLFDHFDTGATVLGDLIDIYPLH
jgi:hypothetical protein